MMRRSTADDPLYVTAGGTYDLSGQYVAEFRADFRAFRDGRTGRAGYSGRPNLALQILRPGFLDRMSDSRGLMDRIPRAPRSTIGHIKWTLGHLWRSIDEFERTSGCERIDDVRLLIGAPWRAFKFHLGTDERIGFAANVYDHVRKAVQAAIDERGIDHELPRNPFPVPTALRRRTESPYEAKAEAQALDALRDFRHGVIERMDGANKLADAGDDPKTTLARWKASGYADFDRIWSPENVARFVRDVAMPDMLGRRVLLRRYGLVRSELLRKLTESEQLHTDEADPLDYAGALYRPFLPITSDFASWPTEVVLKTGINQQVALDFDRADWHEQVGPNKVVMFARKTRSAGKLIEFGSDMGPDSPFAIVNTAIRLSRRSHDMVCRELDELESLPASAVSEAVHRRIETLRALRGRVWLVFCRRPLGVGALTTSFAPLWSLTNGILARRGVVEDGKPFSWSSRRARDGVAYELFLKSGRFLPSVSDGLHHEFVRQSSDYLDHPLSRQEDAKLLLTIWDTMRADLLYLARHGRRPEPPPTESRPPSLYLTMFGPARDWLRSSAPADMRELLAGPTGSEVEG